MQANDRQAEYWRKNLRITGILLAIWFFVTFVVGFFARDLSFDFFGWPFSFWMAAQGAVVIYVLIIWYYARYMNRLDREYGITHED
jgi:putative solute:sodium symporter small subunit